MPELAVPCFSTGEKMKVGALRCLYSAYKKVKRVGDPLEDAEWPHAPDRDYDWNESFYFNFIDPSSKVGGYTRIGILPNQESDIGVMMLYAGGSRLLSTHQSGRVVAGKGGFEIGDLAFKRLKPLSRWRLEFHGNMVDLEDSRMLMGLDAGEQRMEKVDVDITFEGIAPPFNFKNADPGAVAEMVVGARTKLGDLRKVSRVSSEHYEQTGTYSGSIEIGDEVLGFTGSGHRDHSWGVRDWSAPSLWTWLTCQFSDELAFNLSRVVIESVDVFNGFICRGGANYPVRRAALETEFEEDGVTQKRLSFAIEDTGGEVIEVTGDVLTVIPLEISTPLHEYAGIRTPLHPHRLRSAPSKYYRSTSRSRALPERRFDALGAQPYPWNEALRERGHSTLVNEALTEYRWKGRTGYGIAEYLHQMTP